MKIILAIFFLMFVVGCGFSPIYKSMNNVAYNEIIYSGDKNLSRQISSSLSYKENKNNDDFRRITFETKKNILVTSKNSKGQNQSYRMVIYLNLIIENRDKVIEKKAFVKEFSYNNKDNKFELSEYENQIESNLIKEIIEEINIFLNF